MTGKKRAGYIGLCLAALLAALGVQVLASILVMVVYFVGLMLKGGDADLAGVTGIVLTVAGVLLLAAFLPWFYFGCGRQRPSRESLGRVFAPRTLLVTAVMAVGLNYGINGLLPLVYLVAPQTMDAYQQLVESAGLGVNLWANLAAVILAPLGEELIFRGVIFHYARRAVSGMGNAKAAFWIANCIQAFLFGVYHLNLVQGVYAFFIGLALGYLCGRYRSVIPGMLAHLVFNGMSLLPESIAYAWIPENEAGYGLVGVAGIALVVAVAALNKPSEPEY